MKRRKFEYTNDPVVRVGFDTEWVFDSPGKNRILSYQFALLNSDTDRMTTMIVYPSRKCRRITLDHGLAQLFQKARNEKVIGHVPRAST